MAEPKPLSGLRIVITRPREQARALAQLIDEAGGQSIIAPLMEILPLADTQPLNDTVAHLNNFNLAIFISPNAVRYGIQAIQERGASIPSRLKIAAVGQGSAGALRKLGIENVIAPQHKFDSEALLALPELQDVASWRIAIFRGEEGRELLGDSLRARGAHVEYVACYRRTKPLTGIDDLLSAKADALVITSSEALNNLWELASNPDRNLIKSVPLFVPHQRIAEAAHNLGWHTVIRTANGDAGLLGGMEAWAHGRNR
jgi:uroporphyrinogen-III synthase